MEFKTTLKCGGCVAAVKPGLDALPDIESWKADMSGTEKKLIVEADESAEPKVVSVLENAGYKAERVA